ncbi:hypothetical protein HRbin19_00169 [bacterium HR19]|nr:hypothetical protein HRbin19_00169 [bacterium HR19]
MMESIDRALSIKDFSWRVVSESTKVGLDIGYNSIIVAVICPDSQSTTVVLKISEEVGKKEKVKLIPKKVRYDLIYERRVFGGIFLPDFSYEGLEPAVSQIPDTKGDRKGLVVINLSHIGYDKEKGFGYFIRYGKTSPTPACGAIVSLSVGYEPADNDLKLLKKFLEGEKEKDIFQLTLKLFQKSSEHLVSELKKLVEKHKISVVYFGGIEIDISKPRRTVTHNDRILLLKTEVIAL